TFSELGLRSAIRVPLIAKGNIVGSLGLHSIRPGAYGPREQAVLERLARQIAPAIENANLYQELQSQTEEMAVVDEVARIFTSTLEIEEVYEQFVTEVKKLMDFDRMVINLLDEEADTYILKYLHGIARAVRPIGSVLPLAGSQNEKVLAQGRALIREDTAATSEYTSDRDPANDGMHASIMVLLNSKGRPIGTMGLRSRHKGAFGLREQVILERLANQIAPGVENAHLYQLRKEAEEGERLRNRQMEALFNIASTLVQPGNFEEKCQAVLEELSETVQADGAALRVVNPQDRTLHLVGSSRSGKLSSGSSAIIQTGVGVSGQALEQGQPVVANDYPRHPNASDRAMARGVKASVALPIKTGSQILGVVTVVSQLVDHFSPERVKLLCAIGDGLGMLLENARLSQDLQARNQETAVGDEVTRIITSTLDIEEVCEKFTQALGVLVNWDQATITTVNSDNESYLLQYSTGNRRPGLRVGVCHPLAGTQTGYVVQTGQTLVRGSILEAPRFPNDQPHWDLGLRSSIALPLISKGRVIGSLILRSQTLEAYGLREQQILERLARQMAPAIENAGLFEEAQTEKERATTTLAQLKALLGGVDAGILLISNEREVLWANEHFGEFFGIQDVEALMHGRGNQQVVRDYLRRSLAQPEQWFAMVDSIEKHLTYNGGLGELEIARPDYRMLQPFITPVFDESG
ncbi:MAG: GAF domain-containing protein, partial [Dehalococcoidia bacterium]